MCLLFNTVIDAEYKAVIRSKILNFWEKFTSSVISAFPKQLQGTMRESIDSEMFQYKENLYDKRVLDYIFVPSKIDLASALYYTIRTLETNDDLDILNKFKELLKSIECASDIDQAAQRVQDELIQLANIIISKYIPKSLSMAFTLDELGRRRHINAIYQEMSQQEGLMKKCIKVIGFLTSICRCMLISSFDDGQFIHINQIYLADFLLHPEVKAFCVTHDMLVTLATIENTRNSVSALYSQRKEKYNQYFEEKIATEKIATEQVAAELIAEEEKSKPKAAKSKKNSCTEPEVKSVKPRHSTEQNSARRARRRAAKQQGQSDVGLMLREAESQEHDVNLVADQDVTPDVAQENTRSNSLTFEAAEHTPSDNTPVKISLVDALGMAHYISLSEKFKAQESYLYSRDITVSQIEINAMAKFKQVFDRYHNVRCRDQKFFHNLEERMAMDVLMKTVYEVDSDLGSSSGDQNRWEHIDKAAQALIDIMSYDWEIIDRLNLEIPLTRKYGKR